MTGVQLLERPAEKLAETGGFAVTDPADEAPIKLGGLSDTVPEGSISRLIATPTPEPPDRRSPVAGWETRLNLNGLEGNSVPAVRLSSRAEQGRDYGPLHYSLVALSKVASAPSGDPGEWLDAASALKRDAVRVRNSSSLGRHAAVLLTLADALTYTVPSDPTLRLGATEALQRGLSVLTEPFVSVEAEKRLMIELLNCGWNIAPASEGKPPVD
jgi:hypothetical protein